MSRFKRIRNKINKKSSISVDEKLAALDKDLEKTGMLSEEPTMTTSNVYSTSELVPYDPGGEFPVPDPTGVTGSDFTQPVSGDADDPSNWPDAYTDNSWMYNPNEIEGESNRPIVATMDQGVINAWNAANPSSTAYPTGGAGIVFGDSGFGTGVGFAKNGKFYQVLNPGLFGNGSTKIVPPGSPFGSPWFGLFGLYFPATPELANVVMAMSGAYAAAGGYDPSNAMPISLWRNHNLFHDGPYNNYSGKKYQDDTGFYVLQTFYLHNRSSNTYHVNPIHSHQTNIQIRGTEDDPIYPGPIASLFGLGARAFEWLKGKAESIGEKVGEIASEIKTNVEEVIEQGIEIVSETIDINNNGEVDWNDMGRWVNEAIKSQTSEKFNLITAPLWEALPDKGQEWVEENLENVNRTILNEINNIQQKFTGDDMQTPINWIYKFNETAQQNPFEKSKTEVDMTDATDIDTQIDLSERTIGSPEVQNTLTQIKEVDGKNIPLTDDQKKSLSTFESFGVDISGVENQEDFYKLLLKDTLDRKIGSHEDPGGAIASNEVLKNTFGGKPGSWTTEEDINNFVETGELNVHKGIQSEEAGYQFRQDTVDLPNWADFITGLADANPDTVGSGSLINFYGALAVGKLGLKPRLDKDSTGSQSQDLEETPPVPWVYTIKPVETILQENFLYNSPNFLLESKIRTIKKRKEQPSKFGLEIGGFDGNMRPLTGKRKKNFNLVIPKKHRHKFNKKKSGSLKESLNESVRLGLYEPEAMNVDLADIRKGVMPEYPKQPPAEMIDGYHEKSRIRPKNAKNEEPYLKIDKTDLIRSHRLKKSEADEMMNTINMINDYIRDNPADFIHAQMRYPVDDPRLAELNWKMDQMLDAGEEYLDSNFKENKKLFKRATEHTLKNIKITDPKYVQQKYDELRGTPKPKNTKLVGRLGKHLNKYESKSLFKHVNSKDFKKISERKLEKEKFLEKQEQERLDYINDINAEMDEFRSDWRKDISESDFTNITKGNKVGQTFQHTSGATITLDNTMSDPSDQPSQVTLDLGFGEKITVDAPSGNEYGIAGVTKPLDKKVMQKQSVKTAQEINDQIDASEKASESKSARVPIETGDLGYKSTDEILADMGDQWTYLEYMSMLDAIADKAAAAEEPIAKAIAEYSPTGSTPGDVPISLIDAQEAITIARHKAEQALHQAWERYNKIPDLPPVPEEGEEGISSDDIKFLNKQQTLVNLTKGLNQIGLPNDFAQWTINYAKGDMTPITKFSPGMERQVRNLVLDKFKKNPNATTVSIQYDDYGYGFKALPTRLGLGRFTATKLNNGKIRIQDTFNVDKDFTNIGSASIVPGLQDTANRLVDISYKNRNLKGRTDEGGITVDVLIDSGFVKTYEKNKRGSAFNKIKKIRNK